MRVKAPAALRLRADGERSASEPRALADRAGVWSLSLGQSVQSKSVRQNAILPRYTKRYLDASEKVTPGAERVAALVVDGVTKGAAAVRRPNGARWRSLPAPFRSGGGGTKEPEPPERGELVRSPHKRT